MLLGGFPSQVSPIQDGVFHCFLGAFPLSVASFLFKFCSVRGYHVGMVIGVQFVESHR